jgi:molecular chaperone DnaK (HSP70)
MPKGKHKSQSATNGAAGRDAKGQFAPGNRLGRGNPHAQRIAEYRAAIQGAVSAGDLKRIIAKLKSLALTGDMAAIKELLDRTIGKSNTIPASEGIDFELPEIMTTADTVKATNTLLRALSDGRLSPDDGAKMGALIELARRTIETNDLAERIRQLEEERND